MDRAFLVFQDSSVCLLLLIVVVNVNIFVADVILCFMVVVVNVNIFVDDVILCFMVVHQCNIAGVYSVRVFLPFII